MEKTEKLHMQRVHRTHVRVYGILGDRAIACLNGREEICIMDKTGIQTKNETSKTYII